MSLLTNLVDRGIQRAEDTIAEILNPERKHETPEGKLNDAIRAQINASHRFQSFADERDNNFVKWHIDGHDYFYALSEMLDSARECIFITDWWLSPELHLRRPPTYYPEWRFDRIIQRKAQQGVKVYVIVYQELSLIMSMNSEHAKKALEALHPNIACMRHPDHIGSKDDVEFWSHHEKIVVVDNHRACIGGLDICFGRWDTHNHPLADAHPTDFSRTLFPGQDYNNARISDFKDVSDYVSETISVLESPRMPWNDVHMTINGPVVLDIVQHFVERWNFVKNLKYKDDSRYHWLAFPHDIKAAPNEPIARHPQYAQWRDIGRPYGQRFHPLNRVHEPDGAFPSSPPAPYGSCRVQVVRSVGEWSHGVSTEHSIQNAYIQLIREANHFIYIENQYFISNTGKEGPVKNQIAAALVERIIGAARSGTKFKVIVVIPEVPGYAGDVKTENIKTIMAAQYRTINRGGKSIFEELRRAQINPDDYIRFYHRRAYDRLNAPINTFIAQMEANSGIKFTQAEVAYARQLIGDPAAPGAPTHVTIKVPEPTSKGVVVGEKAEAKTEKYEMPHLYSDAVAVVERFESGANALVGRRHDTVADTVGQHALQDKTQLSDEPWLGSKEEELNSYVSELSYIHTKLMIVDDRRVILGSANFNDRSQNGDRDSEIALVVEDKDFIPSAMNGQPYKAARFAATLRRKLFRQLLGLIPPQNVTSPHEPVTTFMRPAPVMNEDETSIADDARVADPLSDEFMKLFNTTARVNSKVFTELFHPIPSNQVRNWKAYDTYKPKVNEGHVVPGIPLERVKERLALVRGSIVEASIDFLIDEKEFADGPEWTIPDLNPALPIYL